MQPMSKRSMMRLAMPPQASSNNGTEQEESALLHYSGCLTIVPAHLQSAAILITLLVSD